MKIIAVKNTLITFSEFFQRGRSQMCVSPSLYLSLPLSRFLLLSPSSLCPYLRLLCSPVAVSPADKLCRCADRDSPGLSNYPENPWSVKWSSLLTSDSQIYCCEVSLQGWRERERDGETEKGNKNREGQRQKEGNNTKPFWVEVLDLDTEE